MRSSTVIAGVGICAWFMWLIFSLSATPVWGPVWLLDLLSLPSSSVERESVGLRGQLGDAFGPFNALVSMLGFVALISTLRVQQNSVAVQLSTLEAQKEAAQAATQLARQQQFQERFFRAVDGYRTQLDSLLVRKGNNDGLTVRGRDGLTFLIQSQLWQELKLDPDIGNCLLVQSRLSDGNVKSLAHWHSEAHEAIRAAIARVAQDEARLAMVCARIGIVWGSIYFGYRAQFDSLFRAWYTAYRILECGGDYNLTGDEIKLYSAGFRGQLSWIELVALLLNQSGLVDGHSFPNSARISNAFCMFDNIGCDNDVIVSCLRELAVRRAAAESGVSLTRAAFGR